MCVVQIKMYANLKFHLFILFYKIQITYLLLLYMMIKCYDKIKHGKERIYFKLITPYHNHIETLEKLKAGTSKQELK